MTANYACPDCGGRLEENGYDPAFCVVVLICSYCDARITEKAAGWSA